MVQSPSWEANWFAASQEIPLISRNPNVHYHTHKRPLPVPILGQPNPVHIPTSHLLEFHSNIHPSTPRSPQWSPSLRFPQQDPIHPLSSPTRATCPAHLIYKGVLYFLCIERSIRTSQKTHCVRFRETDPVCCCFSKHHPQLCLAVKPTYRGSEMKKICSKWPYFARVAGWGIYCRCSVTVLTTVLGPFP